ncbi:arginine decarboxylase-like [Typha latifolia]|uniref:arginine decarboxylase-like n=1 Tax=Typha latifolia TaxID=4733 RepID=UPI003C2EC6F6
MAGVPSAVISYTTDNSAYIYNLDGWGKPYFTINGRGNISVQPHGRTSTKEQEIDLLEAVKEATTSNLQFPLILRFPDILHDRLQSLQKEFNAAITNTGYKSYYQGVYPVKCNQHRAVVEEILNFGKDFNYGLEAGSKPELLLAMTCLINGSKNKSNKAFLVCNGYKDKDYISLALFARSIGVNTYIVLEQEEELDIIISAMLEFQVKPVIGVRAKLLTKNTGHFGSTAGKHGKFGLTAEQIYKVANRLDQCGMLDCLQLLHFHIGSQIPSTDIVYNAVNEAAGIYCNLAKRRSSNMQVLDVGGGMGIDYDGTRSGSSDMSVSYGLEQYSSAVVQAAMLVCDRNGVSHPILCSESGRALVSHHSILVVDTLSAVEEPGDDVHETMTKIGNLIHAPSMHFINMKSAIEENDKSSLQHADQLKKHCIEVGKLCDRVYKMLDAGSDTIWFYHMNFSVFSLTPDFWGIKQLFPIMPIHRLDQRPSVNAVLLDLTCDSDGKVDKFIGGRSSLPLHKLEGGEGYYLGTFLAGAYQEALGSKHNLFGGPSLVHVVSKGIEGGFKLTMPVPGPSSEDQLTAMLYDPKAMFQAIGKQAEYYKHWNDKERELVTRVFHTMPYLVAHQEGTVSIE